MDIKEAACKSHNKKIYILRDELGNVATGKSYDEALHYLIIRRKKTKRREQ